MIYHHFLYSEGHQFGIYLIEHDITWFNPFCDTLCAKSKFWAARAWWLGRGKRELRWDPAFHHQGTTTSDSRWDIGPWAITDVDHNLEVMCKKWKIDDQVPHFNEGRTFTKAVHLDRPSAFRLQGTDVRWFFWRVGLDWLGPWPRSILWRNQATIPMDPFQEVS